ncbi:MAG: MFS transporter [Rhodospirillaceae bacterium]|nr:MFS transporter [Rhodospirillaceae bacterium]
MTIRRYRLNVFLLSTSQALFLISAVTMITFGGLVGKMLADDKSLATLPVAMYVVGSMLSTVPASFIMRRIGRRGGFLIGAMAGMISGALAAYAIFEGSFWLFSLSAFIGGIYQAYTQYYRFAATEAAPSEYAARAISLVLAGGVVSALFGPWIAVSTRDLLAPVPFAGAYVSASIVSLVAFAVILFLQIPKPEVEHESNSGRPMLEIIRQPVFMAAALSAAMSYGLMVLVMTSTPLAMEVCGFSIEATGGVIQGHVLAMFVPSFFSGWLISKMGILRVLYSGMAMFALGAVIAVSGIDFANFFITLVLVGVGWNFLFVGGTTLLAEAYRPEEKAKVQGLNELIVSISAATASFSSGALMNVSGWDFVNYGMAPFLLITLAATMWYGKNLKRNRVTVDITPI